MNLDVVDLSPKIGSELKIDVDTLLNGEIVDDLRALLVRRGVVIARGVHMDDEQQRAFTSRLGNLRLGSTAKEGDGGLMKVTMDVKENPAYAEYFAGTFFWHMDGTYDSVPPFATVLTPRRLSPEGGQTEFCNNYAAFEDLPKDEQAWLETLTVVHTMRAAMAHAYNEPTLEQYKLWASFESRRHPLVWRHHTGRKSLVLSSSLAYVEGLHPAESHELLNRLMAHATKPEYVYRHEWQLGDLLMWDNTGTMHRVTPYDENCGRELHRFTLNGEEPVMAAA